MSLDLQTVLVAARDRSPAFFQTNAPNAVVARYLSDVQNELIAKAVIRDRQFMAQTAVVSIAMSGDDAPGTAGAGTSGGVPGVTTDGVFSTSESSTGSLIEVGVTTADGASVLIDNQVVTSATSTSLTKASAGRTVNGDTGKLLVITAGKGMGQRREVRSNTTDTWAVATWDNTPDATSIFSLVTPLLISDDTAGVATALPSTTTNQGYLIKLDASGVPYIDYTTPLSASVEQGVPLPSMQALLPDLCQVWYSGCPQPDVLWVTSAQRRFKPERFPAVYQIGQTLYLAGQSSDWTDIQSLELRYVPIAPVFSALTDTFLLPDQARPVLVAKAAAFMALRVSTMKDVAIDPAPHLAEANRAEADFLRLVLLGKRGRSPRIRDVC